MRNEINSLQQKKLKQLKLKKKQMKKRILKRFVILCSIMYVFFILVFLLFFSLSLKSCNTPEKHHNVNIQSEGKDVKNIDKKKLYINNDFYLPISAINELTDLKITGDKTELSFIIEENNEYAKFIINTTDAIINGNEIKISKESVLVNGELYLPFDFFTKHMSGLNINLNEKENTYSISLSKKAPEFILKAPAVTTPITEAASPNLNEQPLDFILDLSSYEQYMNPTGRDDYLVLVNTENPLTKEYAPTDLTGSVYTRSDRDTRTLRKSACLALEAFLKEGEANGIKNVTVTSAYRSYDYQNQLFQNEVALLGSEEAASKNVNPPGSSEHQTGLAVDMHNMSAASKEFGKTAEAKWLAENAHKFGFILRYPADKTSVTGISYEPWHFRFVGRYHATKMYELDMCLEEYVSYINQ